MITWKDYLIKAFVFVLDFTLHHTVLPQTEWSVKLLLHPILHLLCLPTRFVPQGLTAAHLVSAAFSCVFECWTVLQMKSESNFMQLHYLVCNKLPSIWRSHLLFCVGEWKAREMLGIITWFLNWDEPGSFLHHVSQEWKLRITDWRADACSCLCLFTSRKWFFKKTVKTANTGLSLLGDINWCSRDLKSFPPPRSKRPLISSFHCLCEAALPSTVFLTEEWAH